MSDRVKGLVVVFEQDMKDEDAQAIMNAVQMIKGVMSVSPSVVDYNDHMNRLRIKNEIQSKLFKALSE